MRACMHGRECNLEDIGAACHSNQNDLRLSLFIKAALHIPIPAPFYKLNHVQLSRPVQTASLLNTHPTSSISPQKLGHLRS